MAVEKLVHVIGMSQLIIVIMRSSSNALLIRYAKDRWDWIE